VKYSTDLIT